MFRNSDIQLLCNMYAACLYHRYYNNIHKYTASQYLQQRLH